jgi:hypothetical protein
MLMQQLLNRPGKRGRTMKLVLPIVRPLRKNGRPLLPVLLPVSRLLRRPLRRRGLLPVLLLRPRLLLLPVLKLPKESPLMLVLDVVAVNTKQLKDSVIPNMLVHRQMCL